MIASARMYSWSPSAAAAWHRLLGWVAKTAEVELTLQDQSDPTPLDALWQREDMGCVFMCGYPWALRRDRPVLLASPVPSPTRYGGRAVYVTDFIVRGDGPHRTLADTFGGAIAYSTEHSHSAYNAPRYHLLAHLTPETFGKSLSRFALPPGELPEARQMALLPSSDEVTTVRLDDRGGDHHGRTRCGLSHVRLNPGDTTCR